MSPLIWLDVAVLLFAFGVVLWSFREVRRVRGLAEAIDKERLQTIADLTGMVKTALSEQAAATREWWQTAKANERPPKNPNPLVLEGPRAHAQPQNGPILPSLRRQVP